MLKQLRALEINGTSRPEKQRVGTGMSLDLAS